MLDPHAREAQLRFAQIIRVFSDEDDVLVEPQNARRPGRVLSGKANVYRSGNMRDCKLHSRASVEDYNALRLETQYLRCRERVRRCELVQRRGALAIQLDISAEVLGPRWQAVGEQVNELLLRPSLKSVIE